VVLRSSHPAAAAKARPYLDWVRAGGGECRTVAPGTPRPLEDADGVLLTGGEDVAPSRYGQRNRYCERIDPERDAFEFNVIRAAWRRDLPLLAVCRGIQVLAVALGGALWQDLRREFAGAGTRVVHRGPRHTDAEHRLVIEPKSRLADLIAHRTITVNSHHHQGLSGAPDGTVAAARSADGLIEAIEYPTKRFVMGVQWHPERWPHPSSRAIMRAFLAACRGR